MIKNTWVSYSGGKDATLALYYLLKDPHICVQGLFSTYNQSNERTSMHGVSIHFMQQQAEALGLPLKLIPIPPEISNEEYGIIMQGFHQEIKHEGATTIGFGDIFLEDLRNYRIQKLQEVNLEAIFPLWKMPTIDLMNTFISLGFKAITVCIDAQKLHEGFLGKGLDQDFINDLPDMVDVCGENGEFHTFVYDGPIFKHPISFTKGEIVSKYYHQKDQKFEFKFLNLMGTI